MPAPPPPRPQTSDGKTLTSFKPHGSVPQTPVIFGQFEVGRSSDEWADLRPTSAFLDKRKQRPMLEKSGDPGQYDPWAYDALTSLGYNQNRKAFDSTLARELNLNIGESYTAPGAGTYTQHPQFALGRAYKAVDSQRSVFQSMSLQRPQAKTFVPGPGVYSPNMNSVYPNQRDSGAGMRSMSDRFGPVSFGAQKSMTPRNIGPGRYAQADRTLYVEAQRSTAKSSRSRPGFGSTSAQRKLPVHAPRDSPAPGVHQPSTVRTPRGYGGKTPRSARGSARTPRGGVEAAFAAAPGGAGFQPVQGEQEWSVQDIEADAVRQVV